MPAGRPPKLTPQLVDRAVELRRDGFPIVAIAERLDVSRRTTQRALARAQDASAVPSAEGTASPAEVVPLTIESALVASIERATRGDWRAAAWLLERLAPERWDRTYRPPVGPTPVDAFAEVDELARRRRGRPDAR